MKSKLLQAGDLKTWAVIWRLVEARLRPTLEVIVTESPKHLHRKGVHDKILRRSAAVSARPAAAA